MATTQPLPHIAAPLCRPSPEECAEDYAWFRERLGNPGLLDRAAGVKAGGTVLLAVPADGRRSGVHSVGSMADAVRVWAALRGRVGFPRIRLGLSVHRDTCHTVDWGSRQSRDDAERGRYFGYAPSAIDSFLFPRRASPKKSGPVQLARNRSMSPRGAACQPPDARHPRPFLPEWNEGTCAMSESSRRLLPAAHCMPEIAGEGVAMSDPRVAAVWVADCGEPLVSLRDDDRFLIDDRKATATETFAMIRSGLVDQLWIAEEYLRERDRRLRVVECYRSPTQQSQYFQEEMSRLAAEHRDLTPSQLSELAGRYVSPPWIAPHSCGGAVDVALASLDGTELDIGYRINATAKRPGEMAFLDSHAISEQVRDNRSLLLAAMAHGGWVPHWYESWHFEIGTRFAALMTDLDKSVYGVITDPHAESLRLPD